jgi:hypothetical protein
MSDSEHLDPLDELRRSNRRWKIFALILSSILGMIVFATGCFIFYQWHRAHEARVEARRQALGAERRARMELEATRREARKNARLNDDKAKPDTKRKQP